MTRTKARVGGVLAASLLLLAGCSGQGPNPGAETLSADEAAIAQKMNVVIRQIMEDRANGGTLLRLNQVETLGCLQGRFIVADDLPAPLRQGLFSSPATYPVTARFANATEFDDSEKDFRGMSIKVQGVSGEPLWGIPGEQDFLLNSHPALFAADPAEFLDFLQATAKGAVWKFFINPTHWDALYVVLSGRDEINDPLAIRYWSTTPYRLGSDTSKAVKYSVRSCSGHEADGGEGEELLVTGMRRHLAKGGACFDFMVQFQGDPVEMPIEDASVIWDEHDSPFQPVARLQFPDQDFRVADALQNCEAETFNPWQSLPEHRPIGGINRVRRAVYDEIGRFRTEANSR